MEDPDELAMWILSHADRHQKNNRLTVNELQTFLGWHDFTVWLTERRRANFRKYDADGAPCLLELV